MLIQSIFQSYIQVWTKYFKLGGFTIEWKLNKFTVNALRNNRYMKM